MLTLCHNDLQQYAAKYFNMKSVQAEYILSKVCLIIIMTLLDPFWTDCFLGV